ncbi:MAG TPA: hypothetical protein VGE07_04170 [Herpetosiphonaceae bacterium]
MVAAKRRLILAIFAGLLALAGGGLARAGPGVSAAFGSPDGLLLGAILALAMYNLSLASAQQIALRRSARRRRGGKGE